MRSWASAVEQNETFAQVEAELAVLGFTRPNLMTRSIVWYQGTNSYEWIEVYVRTRSTPVLADMWKPPWDIVVTIEMDFCNRLYTWRNGHVSRRCFLKPEPRRTFCDWDNAKGYVINMLELAEDYAQQKMKLTTL